MKSFFIAAFAALALLAGCATVEAQNAPEPVPVNGTPTGAQFMAFLFAHANYPLEGEKQCYLSGGDKPMAVTIGDYIAEMVGDDAMRLSKNNGDNRQLTLSTSCTLLTMVITDITAEDLKPVPGFNCTISFLNTMNGNEFVSLTSVRIGISPDMKSIIKGSVNCLN